ncbi:hypothetical protein AAH994_14370 [Weeksellaceae bacterium A-14]
MKTILKFLSVLLIIITTSTMNAKTYTSNEDGEITLVKRNGKTSIVNQDEFNKLSQDEKQLVIQIEASLASLEIYEENGINNYFAIIDYNSEKKEYMNFLVVNDGESFLVEESTETKSCTACNKLQALGCYNQINNSTQNQNSFTVTVTKLSNGCTKLTWTVQKKSTSISAD